MISNSNLQNANYRERGKLRFLTAADRHTFNICSLMRRNTGGGVAWEFWKETEVTTSLQCVRAPPVRSCVCGVRNIQHHVMLTSHDTHYQLLACVQDFRGSEVDYCCASLGHCPPLGDAPSGRAKNLSGTHGKGVYLQKYTVVL